MLNFFAFQWGYQMGIDGALKMQITDDFSARGNVAWGRCKANGLQSGNYLLDTKEITDINTAGGVFCDHSQTITSSAVAAYRFRERTTISGTDALWFRPADRGERGCVHQLLALPVMDHLQCLNYPRHSHLPWDQQKMLVDSMSSTCSTRQYFYNTGEGSIGLGMAHAGMPRSFFLPCAMVLLGI